MYLYKIVIYLYCCKSIREGSVGKNQKQAATYVLDAILIHILVQEN